MKPRGAKDTVRSEIQIVTFRLGEECYGVPVWEVREIIRPVEVSPIPGTASPIEGVINLRGEIIPVIKLHPVLEVSEDLQKESVKKRRIIILDVEDGRFGFVVDEVMEVIRVPSKDVQPPPDVGREASVKRIILGIVQIAGKMVVCLDPRKLFSDCLSLKDISP